MEYLGRSVQLDDLSDDQALYFYLPEKLVSTGSLYDPFDVRRLTTYEDRFPFTRSTCWPSATLPFER